MPVASSQFDFSEIIRAGDHVIWPQGTGEPTGLSEALLATADELPKFTLVVGMVTTPTLSKFAGGNPTFLCLNGAGGARRAVQLSGGRVIPAHVSAIPGLIESRRIPVDVALIRVRPTDQPGVWSLGTMVDFVHEMIAAARVVVAEIDERMPLTNGDTLVTEASITHFTVADKAAPMLPDPQPSDVDIAVARQVAALVPDYATVQLGVGGLPVAVCAELRHHKELGLHSGVIPDSVVDLIQAGVVTNAHKGVDVGATVTGGLFGTAKLYDFANNNREIVLRRATYTHSAATLSSLKNLYTINSAVELDLTGQVNSELAGGRYVGAVGGQVDYVRGGRLSIGGRSIIAISSTTPDGSRSKIVPQLADHCVTTARSDVDMVVTEYGAADLWGLDLPARAKALLNIAHPDFRETLARELSDQVRISV